MHNHFADGFAAVDTGHADRLAYRLLVDGGGGIVVGSTPANPPTPTPTEQVQAATADGTISGTEMTTFAKGTNEGILASEEQRLKAALNKTGAIKTSIEPTAPYGRWGGTGLGRRTTHGQLLDRLTAQPNLTKLDEQIKQQAAALGAFTTSGEGYKTKQAQIAKLKADRAARVASENTVVDVIKDKRQLLGTLEAEKLQLQERRPENAKSDYEALRVKAQPLIEQFRAADGKEFKDDILWFDDWKTVDDDYSFERMVGQLHGHKDRINDWANHQPNDDARAAAQELTTIMLEYEDARGAVEGIDQRLSKIGTEQATLRTSISADEAVLSAEVRSQYAEAQRPPTQVGNEDTQDNGSSGSGTTDPNADSGGLGGTQAGGDRNPAQNVPPKTTDGDVVQQHNGMGASYAVVRGDTLWAITQRYNAEYGTNLRWQELFQANSDKIDNPHLIFPGQVFTIPGVQDTIDAEVEAANAARETELKAPKPWPPYGWPAPF